MLIDPDKANQDSFVVKQKFGGKEGDGFFGVFDGHGEQGHKASQFVRDNLPSLFAKGMGDAKDMSDEKMETVSQWAHKTCSKKIHSNRKVDDLWSGSTSISVYLHGDLNTITVSNVGDSRAVLGSKGEESSSLEATALSSDQTPWRRDERNRIESKGGRILTQDQLFGNAPIDKDENGVGKWKSKRNLGDGEKVLGDEIDESGQPPRVFSPNGDYPGLSVTRTFGDKVISDEGIGVDAEPEVLSRVLTSEDKIIFLASDGVWEVSVFEILKFSCVCLMLTGAKQVFLFIRLPVSPKSEGDRYVCRMRRSS